MAVGPGAICGTVGLGNFLENLFPARIYRSLIMAKLRVEFFFEPTVNVGFRHGVFRGGFRPTETDYTFTILA
jgi:hypothetical protein